MGKIMKMLELPGETVFRETQVILTGKRQALIENYRSILSCTREQIVVLTASGRMVISGKRLEIVNYTKLEMCIRGRIESMILEEGGKMIQVCAGVRHRRTVRAFSESLQRQGYGTSKDYKNRGKRISGYPESERFPEDQSPPAKNRRTYPYPPEKRPCFLASGCQPA